MKPLPSMIAGAVSGLTATVPMTIAMEAMFQRLPWPQRYPLPPRRITMELADRIDVKHELNEDQRHALTLASHLGYGAAMGMLYSLAAQRYLPGAWGGAAYGLGVWAGNYLAMLPATRLHPSATRSPLPRKLLMVAAHLVWGAALGVLNNRLQETQERVSKPGQAPRTRLVSSTLLKRLGASPGFETRSRYFVERATEPFVLGDRHGQEICETSGGSARVD